MGKIFSDLSYNNKTLKPIGEPINELKGLIKEKNDNYNYAIDTKNKTKTALNKIPANEKDKHLVSKALNTFNETFNTFGEALEDRVLDTKSLVNDLNNNYGLTEVQRVAKAQGEYEAELKKRFEEGNITAERMNNAIAYSRKNYQGIKQDEKTGLFSGSFNGRDVADFIDVSKEVSTVLKGFKANKTPLHINGQQIIPDPSGNGYIIAGTTKSVSDAELIQAAKSYVSSNNKIQEQFDEDIFYETNNKDVKLDDVKNVLRQGVSKDLLTSLGINSAKDLNNLEKILEEKNINVDTAYRVLRKDQLTNQAIELGVRKEGFTEYEQKYIKPLNLESDKNDSNSPDFKIEKGLMTVGKMFTQQRISPDDYTKIKEGKEATKNLLIGNKAELSKLESQLQLGQPISKNKINQLKQSINIGNRNLEDFERQERSIKNYVLNKAKSKVPLKRYYNTYVNNIQRKRSEEFNDYKTKYNANGIIPTDAIFGGSDKVKLSVSEFNQKVNDLLDEKYKVKKYSEFENEAIFKYSQKDTNSFSINTGTNFDSATRYVASEFKNKIGGELEKQNVTRDVYAFFTDNLSNTTNTKYKEFESLMSNLFNSTRDSFTFKGKGLEAIIEDELDVNIDNVDFSKASIKPVIEFIDGKPAYVVNVKGKKADDGTYPDLGKVIVNYEGAAVGHEDLIKQVVTEQAKKYAAKFANKPLEGEDLTNYRKLAKSYINSTDAGRELDRLNIYTAEPDKPIKWNLTNNISTNIVPKKIGDNFGDVDFYLQNNNGLFLGKDSEGNVGWFRENEENITLDSFSGADELKEVMGAELLKKDLLTKTNTQDTQLTVNPNTPINFNKLISTESSGNPNAVNSTSGAIGLTQIMPIESGGGSPLAEYNKDKKTTYSNNDLKNPEINKEVGKWYLETKIPQMLNSYNLPANSMYKLIAYNYGIGNLKKWHDKGANYKDLPTETKNYINKILSTN